VNRRLRSALAAFGYCLLGGASVAVVGTVYVVRHVMRRPA
jgi:hypothetical protein